MKTAYVNGIILDGSKDMVPQRNKVIFVEGKKIVSIEDQAFSDLSGVKVVDLKNQYILPGLINLHAHLPGTGKPSKKPMDLKKICKLITSCGPARMIGHKLVASNAKNGLMGGVTTIRAVGSIADFDSKVRDRINSGKLTGPRILTANCAISVPGGHMAGTFAYEAHSAEKAASLVDQIAKDKPDLIKLMITGGVMDTDEVGEPGALLMPEAYIKAACERAHELGFQVAAHCEGKSGVKAALRNGVNTIEHGAEPDEEMMALFHEKGASHILTISPALPYTLRLPGMFNLAEAAVKNSEVLLKGMVALAKKCLEEGIPVGLGTDSACSYVTQYGVWRELKYFVDYCGVTNNFALHTATLVNAEIAGIDNITGSIEVGKMADMIVVSKNPLEEISALDGVNMVIMEGKLIEHPELKRYPEVEDVLNQAAMLP